MARSGDVNQTPATGSAATYIVKERLKTVGWTVPSSSDGTTYNASGDQITTGSSGAGGMANSLAWFVVRDPGSRRQLCFQRASANNTQWRIKYSPQAGFSGGSPGATRVPSATDEYVVLGSGTDASPTMATLYNTDAGYKLHVVAESAVISGSNVYPFWFGSNRPTGECDTTFVFDGLLAGSYDPADADPCVIWCIFDSTTGIASAGFGVGVPTLNVKSVFKHGLGGAAFQSVIPSSFGNAQIGYPCSTTTNAAGTWTIDSYDGGVDINYIRTVNNSTPNGPKGTGVWMKHCFFPRSYPNTFGYNTADPYVYWNRLVTNGAPVLLPWITGTAPSL